MSESGNGGRLQSLNELGNTRFMELDMDYLYLLLGVFGIAVGLISYYADMRGKPNKLGRFTRPAIGVVVICGILLLVLGFT
jgi:H+/Cl- antiporter ClcA